MSKPGIIPVQFGGLHNKTVNGFSDQEVEGVITKMMDVGAYEGDHITSGFSASASERPLLEKLAEYGLSMTAESRWCLNSFAILLGRNAKQKLQVHSWCFSRVPTYRSKTVHSLGCSRCCFLLGSRGRHLYQRSSGRRTALFQMRISQAMLRYFSGFQIVPEYFHVLLGSPDLQYFSMCGPQNRRNENMT